MKIQCLTAGSRGDTQPFVALGKALKARGADVSIAATEDSGDLIRRNGLAYNPVRGNIAAFIRSGQGENAVKAGSLFSFVKSLTEPQIKTALLDITEDLYHACEGSDLILYHPGASIGAFAGKDLGIPAVIASPFPLGETDRYPALLFYNPRPPKWFYRMSHKAMAAGLFLTSKDTIGRFYKERLGREKIALKNPLTGSPQMLVSCSEYLFPGSARSIMRGWWFLDEENYEAPEALQQFLTAGEAPLYIGFGSVADVSASVERMELIQKALQKSGSRAIIASNGGKVEGRFQGAEDIFFVRDVPHSWLFPRTSMVIHHGGAGTSAAGFRAGVPSLIIPHGNDQFAWGRRAWELGIGPRPIPERKLSLDALAGAIGQMKGETMQQRARELGRAIGAERGAEAIADYIVQELGS